MNEVIQAVVALIVALVSAFVIPWLKEKLGKEKLKTIMQWVDIAVQAAEQMANAGLINMPKKEYVISFLQEKGITIDEKELDAMIESAVLRLNQEIRS